MVNRATDKVRQAAAGMPAVVIRLMDSLALVVARTTGDDQRGAIRRQADMILREAEKDVAEPNDLAQIRERYEHLIAEAEARQARSAVSRQGGASGGRPPSAVS
jgi:uncharacterized membrane protein